MDFILGRVGEDLPEIVFWWITSILFTSFAINFLLDFLRTKSIKKAAIFESNYFIKENIILGFIYTIIVLVISNTLYQLFLKNAEGHVRKSLELYGSKIYPIINSNTIPLVIIFFIIVIFLSEPIKRLNRSKILIQKICIAVVIVILLSIASIFNVISIYYMEIERNNISIFLDNKYVELEEVNSKIEKNIKKVEKVTDIKKQLKKSITSLNEKKEELLSLEKKEDKIKEKKQAIKNLENQYMNYIDILKSEYIKESDLDKIHLELKKAYKNFKENEEKNIKKAGSPLMYYIENSIKIDYLMYKAIILIFIYFFGVCLFLAKCFSFLGKSSILLNCKDNKRYRCLNVIPTGTDFEILNIDKKIQSIYSNFHKVNRDDIENFENIIFLEVSNLNTSLNFYKDVFGLQNEIRYTDSNGKSYIHFRLFNKLFEIYESDNSNKDILKKVVEKHNIKCKIYQFDDQQNQINLRQIILSYNSQGWHGNDPQIKKLKKVKIEDPDGYTYILKNKK